MDLQNAAYEDSEQVAQRCIQKEDGYATIVVARARGNIDGVMRRA